MPRLLLETCTPLSENSWLIDLKQRHHLVRVLRCKEGDYIEGLLKGEKLLMVIFNHPKGLSVRECKRIQDTENIPQIHLMLGMLKAEQFDLTLRICTELGVKNIHLLACTHSVPCIPHDKINGKIERWRKIMQESSKQSGATQIPQIFPPIPLKAISFACLPKHRYVALFNSNAQYVGTILHPHMNVVFAVGPEGGWSPDEEKTLIMNDFVPISLGARVLRASTAVACGCSWFQFLGLSSL